MQRCRKKHETSRGNGSAKGLCQATPNKRPWIVTIFPIARAESVDSLPRPFAFAEAKQSLNDLKISSV